MLQPGRAHRIVTIIGAVALVIAAALGSWQAFVPAAPPADRGASGARSEQPRTATREAATPRGWGTAVGFASRARWMEHYEKHGTEFGDISAEDYLRRAQALRDAAAGGPIVEAIRNDGVITRFDRNSGAFIAVNPNGVIRTFFRPNDGERYFHRQLERGR